MPNQADKKKNTRSAASLRKKKTLHDAPKKQSKEDDDARPSTEERAKTGQKRKGPPSKKTREAPSKSSKTSSREVEIIKFLLSPTALSLRQNSKTDTSSTGSRSHRDYFSPDLKPFENLVCAVILSRPISHVLGQRTIKTVLNEPWNWNTAQPILEAGKENDEGKTERVEAMENARTQHRQKTALELGALAETVVNDGWDDDGRSGSLEGLLKMSGGKESELRKLLKKIKGIGDTAVDIFVRKVQRCEGWEGLGWFVDSKTEEALMEVGLPGDGESVRKLVEESGSKNVRDDFAIVLERALGIYLEGKTAQIP